MKIGLLVDGDAEYQALGSLIARLSTVHTVLHRPLLCDIQPFASPQQIALAASKKFSMLLRQGVDAIVILFDKETRHDCTVELVREIERHAAARLAELAPNARVHVVLKVSMFENWLIADPQALRELPGLFDRVERIERKVAPNRADSVNALELLKGCMKQKRYVKVAYAMAICKKLDPERAAANSRSFRKLLKVLRQA